MSTEKEKPISVSIRLDADVKEESGKILDELGMSLSGAVSVFLRQVIRERKIPFEIRLDIPDEKQK